MSEIPLKQWIKGALEASSISKGTAELSPAYISSALRVALSLTRQISDAEELSNFGLFHGIASLPPPFPACIDWADCIMVSLKPNDDIRESSLQFPSSASLSDQADDLDKLFDEISRDVEREKMKSPNNGQESSASADHYEHSASYFNVDCAQIFYGNGDANPVHSTTEKLQRIYSLGLVFYELFSGGESPPLELLIVSSPNGGNFAMTSSQAEGLERSSASCNGFVLPDFASTLKVSGEICFNETGALGRSVNNDHVEDFESSNGGHASCISNKRQYVCSRTSQSASSSAGAIKCDVCVNSLRMKGVPNRLCDLVCNMIDCINGDFMGIESYSEIVDVTSDLELMLYQPKVYLHDLDVQKLSLSGLDLNDTIIERNNELASLKCSYRRFTSGSSELAVITGQSGTGKSTMANQLGDFITADGGLFLSGKFDQMMQQVKPFSAIASAFNSYCDVLTRVEECEPALEVASKLRSAMGADLYYLIQVIPNLNKLIDESLAEVPPKQDDCVDAQQRLQYLFCRFVEVIASCSGLSMTLFMDDVQWADSSSISMIGHLLKTKRFFFLGACRHDAMESDHTFWKMINSLSTSDFETTVVKLECMDQDTVTQVISNALNLSPRLVRSLSDIVYHKTKGNPLFVSEMLLSLNREGLLRLSLSRHRWEWDEKIIQLRKLPDDVAMFFVRSISALPTDTKIALVALSCFGASTECEVIHALEGDLNLNLVEPLETAILEGFVDKLDGSYWFCHDRIQEAAYSMIEEHDRCLYHMNYGLSLVDFSLRAGHTSLLFTAVTQLNRGGPSAVQHAEKYHQIARYNLIAGKKAMEMADFSSALAFFDHGMTFLRKMHWIDHYNLSLELFNLAAKCALATEDLSSVTMLCDEVSRNALKFEDTLSTSFTLMSALTHSRISESVEFGFEVLSQLGVEIPHSSSRDETLNHITHIQSTLDGISDHTLLNYHIFSDYRMVMIMKFLAKLEHSVQQTNTYLQPLITIKIIQLTIEHGLSPMSAIGFAYFGGMLAELGDIRGGYRYTKLARALLDIHWCSEIAGEVLFLVAEMLSYIEPLQGTGEYRIQGSATAMAAGDVHWACMNKLMFAWTVIWRGANLSAVREASVDAQRFSQDHNHNTSLYYLMTFQRSMTRLLGNEDESISTDLLTRNVIENKNPYQLVILYFQEMFSSLVLNNYNGMKQSAEKFFEFNMPSWHLLSVHGAQAFIGGLVSFRIFREGHDPLWAQRGTQFKERIIIWRDQGSLWNFESKCFLLEAEECYSGGNIEKAQESYENAISSARAHKFIHEEALAYELAANMFLDIGYKTMALKYFTCAHEAYFKWGALAKMSTLYAFIEGQFARDVVEASNTAE